MISTPRINTITTAVTISVAQRMRSFCSLGISMIASVAKAGRKTIKDNRITALMGHPALAGQCRIPKYAEQDKDRHRAHDDEQHVLADAAGLDIPQAQAQRIRPGGEQIHRAIDQRP